MAIHDANPNSLEPSLLARAQGCLLGQIAGDSLGSLVEFQRGAFIRRKYPDRLRELKDGGHWDTLAGQPTDDSELALMLARSLVKEGKFDEEAVAASYAYWYASEPFDIGATTARALGPAAASVAGGHAADAARRAASRESQANGALMRISPLGIFGHSASSAELARWARADAALTHPNQVCLDASAVFAVTIAHCVRTGPDAEGAFDFARDWARKESAHPDLLRLLDEAETSPPADFSQNMGWVRIAFQNAFYQLLHARNLEEGVVETVMSGGDTDTNAAIAGALLGAMHGIDAIPRQWRDAVLSCRPKAGLRGVRQPRLEVFWPVDVLELAGNLVSCGARAG